MVSNNYGFAGGDLSKILITSIKAIPAQRIQDSVFLTYPCALQASPHTYACMLLQVKLFITMNM